MYQDAFTRTACDTKFPKSKFPHKTASDRRAKKKKRNTHTPTAYPDLSFFFLSRNR